MAENVIDPKDCPEPFWHETHRYCPVCSWTDEPEPIPKSIWDEIRAERERAHAKHGATSMEGWPPDDPTGDRRSILDEEVGEVAKEFNDARHEGRPVDLAKLRAELIQISSVAATWADGIPSEETS